MSPPPCPARRRARLALLLLGLGACTAAGPAAPPRVVPAGWRLADEDGVRPTLAEIFLDVPPFGEPPRLVGASADARYAVVAWTDPALEEEEASARRLRLVAADAPEHRPAGRPLAELLPPPEPDGPTRLEWAWSHAGHRLALARGTSVWLLDPSGPEPGLAAPFARWEAPADAPAPAAEEGAPGEGDEPAAAQEEADAGEPDEDAPPADEAEPAEDAPPVLALGRVTSVAFREDDGALRVGDGDELVELPLAAWGPAAGDAGLVGLDAAAWPSRDVASPAGRLTWSDDLNVAFGDDPLPRPERSPGYQAWIVGEAREIALEGWAESGAMERASLSPDGRWLVALEVDDAEEPDPVELPDYLTERVTHRDGRTRLADDRYGPVRVWAWNVWTGAREELDLGPPLLCEPPPPLEDGTPVALPEPRDHVWTVGWSRPDEGPPAFALERRSEDHRTLEVWTWRAGELARRHVERDPGWIGGPARRTRWSADGAALYLGSEVAAGSSTPGRCQVFRLHLASGELRQVTAVAGEVKDFRPLPDGGLLVEASGADPARTEVLYYDHDAARGIAGTEPRRYALPPGVASDARAARDGARIFVERETLLQPAEVWAAELDGGAAAVTHATPAAYAELALEPPHKLAVVTPDGTAIHAHVYLPPGVALADDGPPRAAVAFIHGAGYLQNVTDSMTRYPLNALFHVRLARLGYVVVDVDYRGSAGYGGAFRTDVRGHLGGRDLDDVHAVVDELVARGLVDARRVGVYGGSYGGFLTMMALFTAPERWAVGCALRSVTDWRTYHPGYVVPRLGRPSTHAAWYARSSPIDLVDGLEDPLLVLHGMRDSNVFAQDSIRLIDALIDRGKDFDAMLYPSQGHAFEDGEHWLDEYRRIERYLIEHLGPPLLLEGGAWHHAVWIDGCYHPYPFGPYDPGGDRGGPIDAGPPASPGRLDVGGGVRAVGRGLVDAGAFVLDLFGDDDHDNDDSLHRDDDRSWSSAVRSTADRGSSQAGRARD